MGGLTTSVENEILYTTYNESTLNEIFTNKTMEKR